MILKKNIVDSRNLQNNSKKVRVFWPKKTLKRFLMELSRKSSVNYFFVAMYERYVIIHRVHDFFEYAIFFPRWSSESILEKFLLHWSMHYFSQLRTLNQASPINVHNEKIWEKKNERITSENLRKNTLQIIYQLLSHQWRIWINFDWIKEDLRRIA